MNNNNKKGLSMIISTLIIILLVLVAVGIIWSVVKGFVDESTDTIDISTKCISLDLSVTGVTCDSTSYKCSIYLERGPGGEKPDGVALVFTDGTAGVNEVKEVAITALDELGLVTVDSGVLHDVKNPTNVEVTPYWNDASGTPQYCGSSISFAI